MIKLFAMVCLNCNKEAHKTGNYKGKVNYNFTPTAPDVYRLDIHCFTCNTDDMEILDLSNPDCILPINEEDFNKNMTNKARKSNIYRAD